MRRTVRLLLEALALFAVLLLLPHQASAAKTFVFFCSGGDAQPVIQSRRTEQKYTIFLPGGWDASRVRITFENEEPLRFGDLTVVSGEEADLTPLLGKTVRLTRTGGQRLGTVTVLQGSALASVFITVDAKQLSRVLKDKHLIIPEGTVQILDAEGTALYDGALTQFKGRGNNTYASHNRKKPFQLKLADKADLFGMGKARTWLLIASHQDLSLMRNQISLDLARALGLRGAVECVQADLWLNGVYNGLYLLTEKIQIQKNRLDLVNLEEATEEVNPRPLEEYEYFSQKLDKKGEQRYKGYEIPNDPEDITGGYILEIEKHYRYVSAKKSGFSTDTRLFINIKEPSNASRAQAEYIRTRANAMWQAVAAADGRDPVSGAYYTELLDLESFAMKFLVEDFVKNLDVLAASQFFYKDSDRVDPKFYAGPCWDYDLCMGNLKISEIGSGYRPEGSWMLRMRSGKTNWYKQLWQHPEFRETVFTLYRERFRPLLGRLLGETEAGAEAGLKTLTEYREAISASAVMNFTRWSLTGIKGYYPKSGENHEAAADYLADWIRKRVQSMDEEYASLPETP